MGSEMCIRDSQSVMYNTVKEHIIQDIQKDLKNGSDMAVNLRKGTDISDKVFGLKTN